MKFIPKLLLILTLFTLNELKAEDFKEGSISFSAALGQQSFNYNNYFVIGGGIGYFFFDGLEGNLFMQRWFGDKPSITEIKPGAKYVFHLVPSANPQIGTFFRHWFISSNYDDIGSIGFFGGIITSVLPKLNFSLSYVIEKPIYGSEKDTISYPEFGFSFSF